MTDIRNRENIATGSGKLLVESTLNRVLTSHSLEFMAIPSIKEKVLNKTQYLMMALTMIYAVQQLCTTTTHIMKVVFIILDIMSHHLSIHITGVENFSKIFMIIL